MYCFPYMLSLWDFGGGVGGVSFVFSFLQIFFKDTIHCLINCKCRGISFEQGTYFEIPCKKHTNLLYVIVNYMYLSFTLGIKHLAGSLRVNFLFFAGPSLP